MIKFVMKIYYANNKFAKHQINNGSYIVALLAATFHILITLIFLFIVLFCLFPDLYIRFTEVSVRQNSKVFGIAFAIIVPALIKLLGKEDEIKDETLTKQYVTKVVNYFIFYSLSLIIVSGLLGMKFLIAKPA